MRFVAPARPVMRFLAPARPTIACLPITPAHAVGAPRREVRPQVSATGSRAGQHFIASARLGSPYCAIPLLSRNAASQRRMFSSNENKNGVSGDTDTDTQEPNTEDEMPVAKAFTAVAGLGALCFLTARVLVPRFGLVGVFAGYSAAIALGVAVRSLSALQAALLALVPTGCVLANMRYQEAKRREALRELGVADEDMDSANIWREFENNRARINTPDKRRALAYRSFFLQQWKVRFEENENSREGRNNY